MISFWKKASEITGRVYIPKFYQPEMEVERGSLSVTHWLPSIRELIQQGILSVATGDEIGKMAYGTGDIPFVRTSDISNWEIKSAPKQGVSQDLYEKYSAKQDVKEGDIFLVRDGTYLIGTNCFVTALDRKLLYQSHILKFRVLKTSALNPYLLFLALNSKIVQRQIRSFQFTADTIDTIGNRYLDLVLPLPSNEDARRYLAGATHDALMDRVQGKAFIKQSPFLLEMVLASGSIEPLHNFLTAEIASLEDDLRQDTITAEFGHFETFWMSSSKIKDRILLPKYYDPEITDELKSLATHCDCLSFDELINGGILEISTGDEIGKMAYGTGDIPFLRTSDFSNWEIKHDPKQGVSEEIYQQYRERQDLQPSDILLVRDGTYLVGNSCFVTEEDNKALYCGGLYKIRVRRPERITPQLLLGLLNSYIVKRQIRTKQFTRDVIDTIGQRLKEVVLPVPRDAKLAADIASAIDSIVEKRIRARRRISELSSLVADPEWALKRVPTSPAPM